MPNRMTKEYGRKHKFSYKFAMTMNNASAATYTTILPICACDQGLTDPTQVVVNPNNDAFQTAYTASGSPSNSHTCYPNSVVNNFWIQETILNSQATDANKLVMVKKMLVCCSFDDIDKTDEVTNSTLGTILGLKKEATNENQVHPIWSGTDMLGASNVQSNDVVGLTTNQTLETVTFSLANFELAMESGTTQGLIKKCAPSGMQEQLVWHDRPFYREGWFKNHSGTKRMNKNTFVGLLLCVPLNWTEGQTGFTATNGARHLEFQYEMFFNEYNDMFDQGA